MQKYLAVLKDDDPEWLDEVMDTTMLENDFGIIIIDVPEKKDNVIFLSRLDCGYFVSNLLGEMNDKYHEPARELLEESGYQLLEYESETDFLNHVKSVK